MKGSSVYLEAAKLLDAESLEFSCWAIDMVAAGGIGAYTHERLAYDWLFKPCADPTFEGWGRLWGNHDERKPCRVLSLCLMAAIVDYEAKHGR